MPSGLCPVRGEAKTRELVSSAVQKDVIHNFFIRQLPIEGIKHDNLYFL
jgi:hypothetical protein